MLPNQSRGRASGTFLIGVSQLLHLGPTLTSPPSWTKDKCCTNCTQALEPRCTLHGSTLLIFVPWLLVPCNILNFPNIYSSILEIWFSTRSSDVPVLILLWWIYHCRGEKLINSFYSLVGHKDFPIVHSNALLMEELSLLTPFSKNQPEYIFLRCLQVLENSMKFMSSLFR